VPLSAENQPGDEPVLVADVLLLLYQPSSDTIAGENFLFSVLGGAVITDRALSNLAGHRKPSPPQRIR
jgi:hypothetical protein